MIAIVQFNTPNIEEYASLSANINSRYCDMHGHTYIREVYEKTLIHPSVEKLFVVRRHLNEHEWIAWIDSDACIINHRKNIAEFTDSAKDLITSGHEFGFNLKGERVRYKMVGQEAGINGGVFLVRNCPWSHNFLQAWINLCILGSELRSAFWEQGILQWMLSRNICNLQANIELICPASRINREDFLGTDKIDRCDFILHLWGSSHEQRVAAFSEIDRGIIPKALQISMPYFYVPPAH
jgi:hypothetical protein